MRSNLERPSTPLIPSLQLLHRCSLNATCRAYWRYAIAEYTPRTYIYLLDPEPDGLFEPTLAFNANGRAKFDAQIVRENLRRGCTWDHGRIILRSHGAFLGYSVNSRGQGQPNRTR